MFYSRGGCFERRADTPQIKFIIFFMEGKQAKQNVNGTYRNGGANVSFLRHLYLVNGLNPGV